MDETQTKKRRKDFGVPRIDIKGMKFGRLTVIEYVNAGKWKCICDCGGQSITKSADLKSGNTQSCGCIQRESARERGKLSKNPNNTDITRQCSKCKLVKSVEEFYTNSYKRYESENYEYVCKQCKSEKVMKSREMFPKKYMIKAAKTRAKLQGVPFNITEEDFEIPEYCPLLEIKLEQNITGKGRPSDNSPSLDKLIPKLGYVKGNILVVSYRANRIKSDATIEELESLVSNIEKYFNVP